MATSNFARNNNLAIAYYRSSSAAQSEASIAQQRERAHAYAEAQGYAIVKEYRDAARSGAPDERPGFQQMLAKVGEVKPSVLILWKADRLGRDQAIAAMAKKAIHDAGCTIEYVAETTPEDTPEGQLLESFFDCLA